MLCFDNTGVIGQACSVGHDVLVPRRFRNVSVSWLSSRLARSRSQ